MPLLLLFSLFCSSEDFQFTPSPVVNHWVEFLTVERKAQTEGALAAAEIYVPILKKVFREEGVPPDLVWLAMIESSFRTDPVSPSKAAGMFQFKRDTARAFGLRVDRHVDERNMPLKAGRAAARYLLYLHKKFKSWELVLAAYNWGEGDLRRAMAKHGKNSWDEIRPYVRKETRDYVPKIKAAAIIGNRHLNQHKAEVKRHTVVKGDTLYRISKTYGVELSRLRQINGIRGNKIRVGQKLLLPVN